MGVFPKCFCSMENFRGKLLKGSSTLDLLKLRLSYATSGTVPDGDWEYLTGFNIRAPYL